MTDDLFDAPDGPRPGAAPPRKCKRHAWYGSSCSRCGKDRDATASRRGRSSDRLGKDQERRIESVYGPRKVGEFRDAVDHLGRDFKWQAKSTRKAPPKWLAAISEPTFVEILPSSILDPMAHMMGIGGIRFPLVIRSYVHQGVPTRDWLFVVASQWHRLHGKPPGHEDFGYVVIPGASFLDIHGSDEEFATWHGKA